METELGETKLVLAGGLIPCGGRALGSDDYDDDNEMPAARRTDASVEPVFFHSVSSHLWGEILYDFQLGAVIDLTAGYGAVAMASLRAGCPYVGVTLTDTHATELRKHVHNTACQAAATEGDDMYDADLVRTLRGKSRKRMTLEEVAKQVAGTTHKKPKLKDDEASGGGGNTAKAKGKAKPKATAKKGKKAKEHDPFNEDAPDAEAEESDEDDWDCDSDNDGEEECEGE